MGWQQHPDLLHMAPTQPLCTTTVVRQESTENVMLSTMWCRQPETKQGIDLGTAVLKVCDTDPVTNAQCAHLQQAQGIMGRLSQLCP